MLNTKALAATAGGAKVYVEDVFSTYLYTGNGSTQTITNDIDLSGEGGLVWIKSRTSANPNVLFDTARGANKSLRSNSTIAQEDLTSFGISALTSFGSAGFTLGNDAGFGAVNTSPNNYASWTFRKASKFFDVVTYTGNNVAGRTIAHNLGSVPGCIIVKNITTANDWSVYHRANTGSPETDYLTLNSTAATTDDISRWNDTAPTASVFTVGDSTRVNSSGDTYVAYLFAHDAGGFGDSGNDNVISCGSYTGNGSATGPVVTLGWEPQWLLIKRTSDTGDWQIIDNMRGFVVGGTDFELNPNNSLDESNGVFVSPTPTGFQLNTTFSSYNASGQTYIYIAIRRGPMKTPTDATKVFDVATKTAANPNIVTTTLSYVDSAWNRSRASGANTIVSSRLTGGTYLQTQLSDAEIATTSIKYDYNGKVEPLWWNTGDAEVNWLFRRAPGFFDVVAYTGTGSARTVSHNLGVVPEMFILKSRTTDPWVVYHKDIGNDKYFRLNANSAASTDAGIFNSTTPTSSSFTLGGTGLYYWINQTSTNYIAYLFATCPGVSKVGSYTGTGTTLSVDCGFTNGARFVLIKRTDSTGDWYVWDTARGIVSGNDSYLLLNSTAAEVTTTDYIDPLSSGFQISSTAPAAINASGGSFIFLAVA